MCTMKKLTSEKESVIWKYNAYLLILLEIIYQYNEYFDKLIITKDNNSIARFNSKANSNIQIANGYSASRHYNRSSKGNAFFSHYYDIV